MRDYFSTTPQGLDYWKEHHHKQTIHTLPAATYSQSQSKQQQQFQLLDLGGDSSTNNNQQSQRKMSSRYNTLPPPDGAQYFDNLQQQQTALVEDSGNNQTPKRYSQINNYQKNAGGVKYSQSNINTPYTQMSSPQRIFTAFNQSVISNNTHSSNFNTTFAGGSGGGGARTMSATTAVARSQNTPYSKEKMMMMMMSHPQTASKVPQTIYEQQWYVQQQNQSSAKDRRLKNLSINLPATALPQSRNKIPRELPLSSSPARNSYQIMKDRLRVNFFKHNEFNPALLSNTNRQVLDGVLDPQKPVIGSSRRVNLKIQQESEVDSSSKKAVKNVKKLQKNEEQSIPYRKVRVKTAQVNQSPRKSSKLKGGRTGSLPETKQEEKKRIMLGIQEQNEQKPEGQTINDIIVKHGSYVKKYLSYEKPVFALFTGQRAPLLKKVSPQASRRQKLNQRLAQNKIDKTHKNRLITSKFKQNQENSNLQRIFHSKENSIKQFIKMRMKKFKPSIVSTHPSVRGKKIYLSHSQPFSKLVAKQLKGTGKEMNKIAPRMRGVIQQASTPANKDSEQREGESGKLASPASAQLSSRQQKDQSQHASPTQVVNLSDDHANLLSQLNGLAGSSSNRKNSNFVYNQNKINLAKNKAAMSTTLPILFEQRHQPSQHDSIFNISIDGNCGGAGGAGGAAVKGAGAGGAGKMSIRKYNIEKRKAKIQRQSEVKKIKDQKKKLIDQEKRKFIEQAFKDDEDFITQDEQKLSKSSKKRRLLDSFSKNRGSTSSSFAAEPVVVGGRSAKKSIATTSRKNSDVDIAGCGFRSTRQSPSPQNIQSEQNFLHNLSKKIFQQREIAQQRRQIHPLKQQKTKKNKRKPQSMTQQQNKLFKRGKNPIQQLMKLVRKKSDKNLKVKQILAQVILLQKILTSISARNKIGRACRQMQAAVSSFLDNLNLQQDQYDRDQTNLYDMMDQAHVRLQIDEGVKQGQNLKDIKEDTKNTHLFVNQLQNGSKKLWKPDKLRISPQTLKLRTEEEANKALIFQPNQKTAAEKAPSVEIPALRDTNFEIVEHSVKMT